MKKNKPEPRNPIAPLLRDPKFRKKVAKSDTERADQRDPWSKKAKHKNKAALEESFDRTAYGYWISPEGERHRVEDFGHATVLFDNGVANYHDAYEKGWVRMLHANGDLHVQFGAGKLTERGLAALEATMDHFMHFVAEVVYSDSIDTETFSDDAEFLSFVRDYGLKGAGAKLAEFYSGPEFQVGDKIEIIKGPLKAKIDKEKVERKKQKKVVRSYHTKDDEAIVRNAEGPAGTLGITINGEYHLVDPEDVKLLTEAFQYDDLTEWSYAKTTSGIDILISNEEQEMLNICSQKVYKRSLDEREQELARRMVSRGILDRGKDEGGLFFCQPLKKLKRF